MPRERELKLELDPAAALRIAQWLRGRGAKPTSAPVLRSIYFDTDDFYLNEAGVVFRIRKERDSHTQTIKQFGPRGAGLFDRPEWEAQISDFTPDFLAARATGLKLFRRRQLALKLHPVFEIQTRRRKFDIPGEQHVLLTIDRGRVLAGRRARSFCEIEIESLDGRLDALFRIAGELADVAAVRLAVQSKSDRGYALLKRKAQQIFRAEEVSLAPEMPAQDAFRMIARECLRQLASNVRATVRGEAEALHQMRVGLRRLRACITVFSKMLDSDETAQMKADLRWIGRCLGEARDLDVMIDELPKQQMNGAFPNLTRSSLEQQRRKTYLAVRQDLQSRRFRRLLLDILKWIECGSWVDRIDAWARLRREQPVMVHAAAELQRRYKKLVREAAMLKELDPVERHALRIRAKRLRYAAEFFAGIFPGRKNTHRRDALLSGLKDLQNTLGRLNDMVNRERLVSEIMGAAPGGDTDAVTTERSSQRAGRLISAAEKAARNISDAKPFWD
jgi:inorganic triphosphatase YgiF